MNHSLCKSIKMGRYQHFKSKMIEDKLETEKYEFYKITSET